MDNKHNKKNTRLIAAVAGIAVLLIILVWNNLDALFSFIWFVRDREAVIALLDKIGFIGPLVLVGMVGLQILIPSLPSQPPIIASAYVYGFVSGFLMSWLGIVVFTQAVFSFARYACRPVVEWFVPDRLLQKWTRKADEKGAMFFFLAFVLPPIPSDLMVYVAGLSAIDQRRFLLANVFGRLPLVVLFSLVGANGFRFTPVLIVSFSVFIAIMLVAWWHFIVRKRPSTLEVSSC
jgi:uncharacterized membrane protein YdjX (TVP38/TMEM64 family)